MNFITKEDQGVTFINLVEGEEVLFSVAPGFGAKLVRLRLGNKDGLHDLLWHMSAEDLKTNDWYKSALLFPYPNRLEKGRYHFNGNDHQFPINEPDKNNQLHGMVYDVPFEVLNHEVRDEGAHLSLVYRYDGAFDYYPFPFDFIVTYSYNRHGFKVKFEVLNTGVDAQPFGIGWHPYFQINGNNIHQYKLEIPEVSNVELNGQAVPTGKEAPYTDRIIDLKKTRLDNCLHILGANYSYSLLDEKSGIRIDMKASEDFDYIQVFTPPGDESVAVEPMTCNVNAFNNGQGLKVLKPEERFKGEFELTVS